MREKRHRQHVLETLFMHTQRRLLATAMHGWLQHTRAMAAARAEAAHIAAERQRSMLLVALVAWRSVVEAQHAQRALLAKAVMRIAACRLRWAMRVWREHTEDALDAAAQAEDDEETENMAYKACCGKLQVGDHGCDGAFCTMYYVNCRVAPCLHTAAEAEAGFDRWVCALCIHAAVWARGCVPEDVLVGGVLSTMPAQRGSSTAHSSSGGKLACRRSCNGALRLSWSDALTAGTLCWLPSTHAWRYVYLPANSIGLHCHPCAQVAESYAVAKAERRQHEVASAALQGWMAWVAQRRRLLVAEARVQARIQRRVLLQAWQVWTVLVITLC